METYPTRTTFSTPSARARAPRPSHNDCRLRRTVRGVTAADQASIQQRPLYQGEITGSGSLFIDCKLEGIINLNGNRVTVGRNGQVAASITAREVVVLGKVRGNVTATDRVDIRAEGALTGDVAAARISIEDGAFFKGGIDIRKPDVKPAAAPVATPAATPVATPTPAAVK